MKEVNQVTQEANPEYPKYHVRPSGIEVQISKGAFLSGIYLNQMAAERGYKLHLGKKVKK